MLIEIHMIQNHSPSNLNRDDLGAPKTCIFGGVTRARISSQCLKRSIRRSPEFAAALEKDGGVRTRRLAAVVARIAESKDYDLTPAKLKAFLSSEVACNNEINRLEDLANAALELGGVKPKSKKKSQGAKKGDDARDEEDSERTDSLSKMLVFLSTATIAKMAKELSSTSDAGTLAKAYKQFVAEKPPVPDIALCGRMTEVAKNGVFSDLNFTVEAALSAAHAISTHAIVNEVDYFTAADDVPGQDAGAGHVNEAMFNSACFYKHFCIDWEQLLENLGGDVDLAATTVKCFLKGAAKANPSGKQHAFAAFNFPDGILVEVKKTSCTPVSYANAFADPVPEKSQRGLIGESIARLGQYVHDIETGYGIEAQRFWFSPSNRYSLTYVEDKQEKPVIESDGSTGHFAAFVDLVMKAVDAQPAGAAS